MLGLFQTDLPIGRRLWIILLTLVVSGALSNGLVSLPDNPVAFATQTLLFFGHVTIFSFVLALLPAGLVETIQYEIGRRRKDGGTYRVTVGPRVNDSWLEPLLNVAFVAAVILSAPLFGKGSIEPTGILGLLLLLFTELFDVNSIFFKDTLEFLELKTESSGNITANLYVESELKKQFTLSGAWLSEISRLLSDGWEIFESSNLAASPTAILRRSFSTTRLSKRRESKRVPKQERKKRRDRRKD